MIIPIAKRDKILSQIAKMWIAFFLLGCGFILCTYIYVVVDLYTPIFLSLTIIQMNRGKAVRINWNNLIVIGLKMRIVVIWQYLLSQVIK